MRSSLRGLSLLVALAFLAASPILAVTFTVTNTADSGAGSLRQAILDANAAGSTDTIGFAIVGSGVHTISPASALPQITGPVTVDGYTQSGSSANTNAPDEATNAVILIELDGTNTGVGSDAAVLFFAPGSGGSAVRGLAINRGHYAGIRLSGVAGMVIAGNFIGTDPSGTVQHGNTNFGILGNNGPSNVTVGGTTPAARNLISGNGTAGIDFGSAGLGGSGHLIQGNLIGTDASGGNALGGEQVGVEIDNASSSNITIGGTTAAARNVISGNLLYGVRLNNGSGLVVRGNFIGTDVTGTAPLPNANYGLLVEANGSTIGGSTAGAGNVISANSLDGISIAGGVTGVVVQGNLIGTDATGTFALGNHNRGIAVFGNNSTIGGTTAGQANVVAHSTVGGIVLLGSTSGNAIRGNSIYANGTIGIDLSADGVTPNDALDADTGPNGRQNYPIITSSAPIAPSGTEIIGTLDSTPSTTYELDFFANPACAGRPHDFEEGLVYIGSSDLSTDGAGHAAFDVTLAYTIEAGQRVTVTATDPAGNTSELSPRLVFSISPVSGVPAGGTLVTIRGTNFSNGATVTIGGLPATDFLWQSSTQVEVRTPALPAGSLGDVTLTNPDATTGTLSKGWVADFNDVPLEQPVPQLRHDPRLQRDHRGRGRRQLRRREQHPAPADGRVPSQGQVRHLLRASALRRNLHGRPVPVDLRPLDRGPRVAGHHRRLRRDQLLPGQPRAPRPDGRLPAEDRARVHLYPARLHRHLHGRHVPVDLCRLDRAAGRRRRDRRLRRDELLPAEPQHAGTDGRVHRQDLFAPVIRPGRPRG